MKTEYFEYLIMLKQAGSINKSATMLHTSPQNVSRIMKQIEDELNTELFKRLSYGVEFTEAGEKALEIAVEFSKKITDFKEMYGKNSAQTHLGGELYLTATKIQNNAFLNNIVMKFTKQYPEIKINLIEDDFFSCMEEFELHTNILGVLPLISDKNFMIIPMKYRQKYIWEILNQDSIAVLINNKSIFNRRKAVPYQALSESQFVIYARNSFEDGFWSQLIANYIKPLQPIFIASNSYMFFNKIIEDGYIGLGCQYASAKSDSMQSEYINQNINFIPIQGNDIFYNCLVYDKDRPLSETTKFFIKFLKQELSTRYIHTNQES